MEIIVIGAGAAGCLCAIELKRRMPDAGVTVLEAGSRPLAKVAVTGGGRCNITNSFQFIKDIREAYPRGTQLMKRALKRFGPEDTIRWFAREEVQLVCMDDGCYFPKSMDAMEVVRSLQRGMRRLGVTVRTGCRVTKIETAEEYFNAIKSEAPGEGSNAMKAKTTGEGSNSTESGTDGEGFIVTYQEGGRTLSMPTGMVVITTGGSHSADKLSFLPDGLEIVRPVPSLFTFRVDDEGIRSLMGTVVQEAELSIPGSKIRASGTLLLTDWGMSGPAALKLSSYGARFLAENAYKAPVSVNWLGGRNEQMVRGWMAEMTSSCPKKMLAGTSPEGLTARLWEHVLHRAGIRTDMRWAELGSKGANRLASTLCNDTYAIAGRAAFKEEFVTCGGVSLDCIDPSSLESKAYPGLLFAGEVLDIDAITGGFNLQAAWTTGYICAESASKHAGNLK